MLTRSFYLLHVTLVLASDKDQGRSAPRHLDEPTESFDDAVCKGKVVGKDKGKGLAQRFFHDIEYSKLTLHCHLESASTKAYEKKKQRRNYIPNSSFHGRLRAGTRK